MTTQEIRACSEDMEQSVRRSSRRHNSSHLQVQILQVLLQLDIGVVHLEGDKHRVNVQTQENVLQRLKQTPAQTRSTGSRITALIQPIRTNPTNKSTANQPERRMAFTCYGH